MLNDTREVNSSQCRNHPNIHTADFDTNSKLNVSKNADVEGKNHPDKAFPPLFGKTLNKETGQYKYLLFDPKMEVLENTPENPIPDGGSYLEFDTKGATYCANAPRSL